MNNRMAVRAQGDEIAPRVNHVPCSELRYGGDVVNFYEALRNFPVALPHVEAAAPAGSTVDRDRSSAIATITLIAVDLNRCERAFRISDDTRFDCLAFFFRREDRNDGSGKPACPAIDDVSI